MLLIAIGLRPPGLFLCIHLDEGLGEKDYFGTDRKAKPGSSGHTFQSGQIVPADKMTVQQNARQNGGARRA
jgi:hypothetical protein